MKIAITPEAAAELIPNGAVMMIGGLPFSMQPPHD
jgi:hypothetical protein